VCVKPEERRKGRKRRKRRKGRKAANKDIISYIH